MSRRVLILGARGLLGRSLLRHLPAADGVTGAAASETPVVFARDKDDLPMEDMPGLTAFLRREAIDQIVLLAAWTQVDACQKNPEEAFRLNGILPGQVGLLAERLEIPLLYMSTDYVFDGETDRPYREYDQARPLSVYGQSKWHGECALRSSCRRVTVVRTSGLYGPGGPDFVGAIRARLSQGPTEVVTDEICSPTYVEDLAPALWRMILGESRGTWHLAALGEVSRFEMARRIASGTGQDSDLIRPTTRLRLGRPAPRPRFSPLNSQAAREAFGLTLPSWEDGLGRFLARTEGAA